MLQPVRFGLSERDLLISKLIHLPPWVCQSPPQLQLCSLTVAAYHPLGIWQPASSHTYIYSPVTKECRVMRNMFFLAAAPIPDPCFATFLCSTDSLHTREIRPVGDDHLIDAVAPVNHANLTLALPVCWMNLLCARQMSVLCCLMCFCGGWWFWTSTIQCTELGLLKEETERRDVTLNTICSKLTKMFTSFLYFILENVSYLSRLKSRYVTNKFVIYF